MPIYNTNDTIVAVSSGLEGPKKIIRLAGDKTFDVIKKIISENLSDFQRKIYNVNLLVNEDFLMPAEMLVFKNPDSYTGDDLIELHIYAADVVIKQIIVQITQQDVRLAEPGEFTARAFFNGKIGLAQAEAVAQIVSAGSQAKLNAAQKLLAGRLSHSIAQIRGNLLDIMSLIEAGLDFSDQNIEIVSKNAALERVAQIRDKLQNLLDGCIYYEAIIDMPAVGIAGAPNAGKSSLTNALLGFERSIVSEQTATTRDVLTGKLELENNSCILFDCAGLISDSSKILDQLAQQAAIEAIKSATIMLFCIEADKDDYSEDVKALQTVKQNFTGPMLCVITKCDQIENENSITGLEITDLQSETFFTSSKTSQGLGKLKKRVDEILGQAIFSGGQTSDAIAINRRHVETVTEAGGNIKKAIKEISSGNEELAAMFLRNAHQVLSGIENEPIDEKMLEKIFAGFCIGK